MQPTLPTDNLYKFVTVLGVALIAVAVGAYVTFLGAVVDQTANARAAIERTNLQLGIVDNHTVVAEIEDADMSAAALAQLQAQVSLLQNDLEAARSSLAKAAATTAHFSHLIAWLYLTALLGLTAFIGGLFLWYRNHQRYKDELLRHETQLI